MKTRLVLIILFFFSLVNNIYADEIKSLSELKISDPENYSQNLMERCSVI